MLITCPFVFAATAAPSTGFSTAASSFPAVLEMCAPMLLVQQRNPTDQGIEQRPQASSQKFNPSPDASFSNRSRGISTKPKWRVRIGKMWRRSKRNAISSNFFEFVNGEIGPTVNEMLSTTPKSADEWATGLWRQSHHVSTNHKSEFQQAGRRRGSWSWRRERGSWTIGETTTTWPTTSF